MDRTGEARGPRPWASALLAALAVCLTFVLAGCSVEVSGTPDGASGSSTPVQEETSATGSSESQPQSQAAPVATQSDEGGESATRAGLGSLTAWFIDVGQGDSELVSLPDGKWMLIDAGDVRHGDAVVAFLKARGVSRIDYLVATHPHADHIGGMPDVLAAFDVGEVWMPDASEDTKTFNSFLDAVEAKGAPVRQAVAGATIVGADAGYAISVLGPAAGTSSDDMNDYSAVIRVDYGSTSFLFTGDASAREIVDDRPGHVDVLKAAHHGSDTGTDAAVLSATTPRYVVLSYGLDNSYGHPDQSVLDAISAAGAVAYGTGAQGDITAVSDGSSVTMSAARQGVVAAGSRDGGR